MSDTKKRPPTFIEQDWEDFRNTPIRDQAELIALMSDPRYRDPVHKAYREAVEHRIAITDNAQMGTSGRDVSEYTRNTLGKFAPGIEQSEEVSSYSARLAGDSDQLEELEQARQAMAAQYGQDAVSEKPFTLTLPKRHTDPVADAFGSFQGDTSVDRVTVSSQDAAQLAQIMNMAKQQAREQEQTKGVGVTVADHGDTK